MSKRFQQALRADQVLDEQTKQYVFDLMDSCVVSHSKKASAPRCEITQELIEEARSKIVQACNDDGQVFYLNPSSRRWVKENSGIGKMLRWYFHHDVVAKPEEKEGIVEYLKRAEKKGQRI